VTAALEVDSLRKTFGKLTAVDGVCMHLQPGERLALLGPNGAGKTTLIRCICGLTRPDQGRIRCFGQPLPKRGGREMLGVIPQEIALYADLSARENLAAFGRFHGLRGRRLRRRISWALEWTGLQREADAPVKSYSGGMKRRINIACGVLHEPQIVLLDEPTVGVDPQSRQRIFSMLRSLSEAGTSILLTTHHLDEAQSQCDRIVIIDHGRIAAEGTLSELIANTIGPARQVRVKVAEPVTRPLDQWHVDASARFLSTRVTHVASQLPDMLVAVHHAGYTIDDVEVQAPTLHHVFLHVTGDQLRD
jgi:ABC-2 type transport system ATP-binding protein